MRLPTHPLEAQPPAQLLHCSSPLKELHVLSHQRDLLGVRVGRFGNVLLFPKLNDGIVADLNLHDAVIVALDLKQDVFSRLLCRKVYRRPSGNARTVLGLATDRGSITF